MLFTQQFCSFNEFVRKIEIELDTAVAEAYDESLFVSGPPSPVSIDECFDFRDYDSYTCDDINTYDNENGKHRVVRDNNEESYTCMTEENMNPNPIDSSFTSVEGSTRACTDGDEQDQDDVDVDADGLEVEFTCKLSENYSYITRNSSPLI